MAATYNKGSQVQILSARQNKAGDLRKRRSPFSLVSGRPSKTPRFEAGSGLLRRLFAGLHVVRGVAGRMMINCFRAVPSGSQVQIC
jgi:hypothetical protein